MQSCDKFKTNFFVKQAVATKKKKTLVIVKTKTLTAMNLPFILLHSLDVK